MTAPTVWPGVSWPSKAIAVVAGTPTTGAEDDGRQERVQQEAAL
jgi:hypothetical protein